MQGLSIRCISYFFVRIIKTMLFCHFWRKTLRAFISELSFWRCVLLKRDGRNACKCLQMLGMPAKVWQSVPKANQVFQKLRKYGKCWENVQKCTKKRERIRKCAKVCKSVQKCAKRLQKCAKVFAGTIKFLTTTSCPRKGSSQH